jgi:threonine/homoserine/homoserine lactone efflux protein
MSAELFLAALAAGMLYVLVPGPATLAVLALSASRGRRQAAIFLFAHLVGDVFWSLLALAAIVGLSSLGPSVFELLGLCCGCYLIWLGFKALTTKASEGSPMVGDPLRAGLLFGLTNPKAYPFAIAMFTALLGATAGPLDWSVLPVLLAGCILGFIIADVLVILWTGAPPVRRLFQAHRLLLTRTAGVLFMAFGGKSVGDAVTSFRSRS